MSKGMIDPVTIRRAEPGDADGVAALHAEAWRYAYRGIIPGIALERMIARRGPAWWRSESGAGSGPGSGTLVLEFDRRIMGYASYGRCRMRSDPPAGEIYELYVRPECHGAGFGRALFEEARRRLSQRHLRGLVIWALADNELACRFYEALGGQPRLRAFSSFAGERLEQIGYRWP